MRSRAGDDTVRENRPRKARSSPRLPSRHPAEVTADRLKDHYERWHDKLAASEHTNFEVVIRALEEIATGGR